VMRVCVCATVLGPSIWILICFVGEFVKMLDWLNDQCDSY
jgi:hypothetical protein